MTDPGGFRVEARVRRLKSKLAEKADECSWLQRRLLALEHSHPLNEQQQQQVQQECKVWRERAEAAELRLALLGEQQLASRTVDMGTVESPRGLAAVKLAAVLQSGAVAVGHSPVMMGSPASSNGTVLRT